MYKITDETAIEEDINYIIRTFHDQLDDFIENLNEVWNDFFYKTMEYLNLKLLKDNFFLFTTSMLDHIAEEEDEEFPLLIESYNNNELPKDDSILKKIVEEHNNFEKEFDAMDDAIRAIDIKEWERHYKEYFNLLKLFTQYKTDSLEHIQEEILLLKKFYKKLQS